ATRRTCKGRLFMTVSRRGEPRTLSGRGSYVNTRTPFVVPEPQLRRNQGLAPAHQDGGHSGAFHRPDPTLLQRGTVPPAAPLSNRPPASGRRKDPRGAA